MLKGPKNAKGKKIATKRMRKCKIFACCRRAKKYNFQGGGFPDFRRG
jgi:hypothetical protein